MMAVVTAEVCQFLNSSVVIFVKLTVINSLDLNNFFINNINFHLDGRRKLGEEIILL